MTTDPSQIILKSPEEVPPPSASTLYAFGDSDDALRLTVLLSDILEQREGHKVTEYARVCRDPKAAPHDRIEALRRAVQYADSTQHRPIALVDIDALSTTGDDSWTGDRSPRISQSFADMISDAVGRGGWWLYRTSPPRFGTTPSNFDLDVLDTDEDANEEDVVMRAFSADCHTLVRSLVSRNTLTTRDLRRIREGVESPDAYVVRVAYDTLSRQACGAIRVLAALRPPQCLNGVVGPMTLRDGEIDSRGLPKSAVLELVDRGMLLRSKERSTVRVARIVRDVLEEMGAHGLHHTINQLHSHRGTEAIEHRPNADVLEVHHHAVCAGDIDNAMRTATFYGTELRSLATRISLDAQEAFGLAKYEQARRLFSQAARLFEHVVRHFDHTDAYSWEYFAYNLARSRQEAREIGIAQAYARAHQLWRNNPLYHGRLLGYRAECGQDVIHEVIRGLDQYVQQLVEHDDGPSYFAEAVIHGMRRGRQFGQLSKLLAARRTILAWRAPKALELAEERLSEVDT